MSTCRCCGQHIEDRAEARSAVRAVSVDDAVLALCNAAYEDAIMRGDASVEIAHLVVVLARSSDAVALFAGYGLDAREVRRAGEVWLASVAMTGGSAAAVTTSDGLKQLLAAAEARALRHGRSFAGTCDVIDALVNDSIGISSSFMPRAGSAVARETRLHDSQGGEFAAGNGAMERTRGDAARDYVLAREAGSTAPMPEIQSLTGHASEPREAMSADAGVDADATLHRLMERDFAWMLQPRAFQTGQAEMRSIEVNGAAARAASGAHLSQTQRYETNRAANAEARGANAPPSRTAPAFSAETGRTSDGDHSAALLALTARIEAQERQFAQRLDMQQRMLMEMAETFTRSLRDLARSRESVRETQTQATRSSSSASSFAYEGSERDRSGVSQNTSGARAATVSGTGEHADARTTRDGDWQRRRNTWSAWQRSQREGSGPASSEPGETPDHARAYAARLWPEAEDATNVEEAFDTKDTDEREKRFYLALSDDIERAPSIGPKTASHLNGAGLLTVRDLLRADPSEIAGKIPLRHITSERIAQWQAQSRLVCSIPWLRGTHAQLLAGAGFDTVDKIKAADVASVCAAILRFAGTRDGQSILRSASAPGEDWVEKRLQHALEAEPERAAA